MSFPRSLQLPLFFALASSWGACAAESVELTEQTVAISPEAPPRSADLGPIERHLYPPDLVLDHQQAIALDETQRSAILGEVRATQAELVELDANLRRDTEVLGELLDTHPIDETAALAASERVIGRESQIKTAHLRLLIRIKNQLTADQRASLDRLR